MKGLQFDMPDVVHMVVKTLQGQVSKIISVFVLVCIKKELKKKKKLALSGDLPLTFHVVGRDFFTTTHNYRK